VESFLVTVVNRATLGKHLVIIITLGNLIVTLDNLITITLMVTKQDLIIMTKEKKVINAIII